MNRVHVLVAVVTLASSILLAPASSAQESTSAVTDQALAELAPTGTLRVALSVGNENFIRKDATTGELSGIWPGLVRELALRLARPYSVTEYPNVSSAVAGVQTSEWDITLADRQNIIELGLNKDLDATAAYAGIPWTYLVPADSSIYAAADADQPGVRIAINRTSSPRSLTFIQAQEVSTTSTPAAFALLAAGQADALAGSLTQLLLVADQGPDYRVLSDHLLTTEQAIAVRKGRPTALAYLKGFVEETKASGDIQRLIERWGVRGAEVAPLAP